MKFSQIPANTFEQLQLNAGILLSAFTPATGTFQNTDILGATSGGNSFSAKPAFVDYGEDVDNCPANTLELKRIDGWEVKMSGSYVTVDTARAKSLIGAADIGSPDTTKVTPRNNLVAADFTDIWWVGDYSDKNGATKGGFIAIKLINALSTGGLQIKSAKGKGQFAFEYTGHSSIETPDVVPFELYIKAGQAET